MSGIGTGYDLSTTTYSPDGKVFQVDYAGKAVDNGGLALGIKCSDGVVLGVEKLVPYKMLVPGSNRRIAVGMVHIPFPCSHGKCAVYPAVILKSPAAALVARRGGPFRHLSSHRAGQISDFFHLDVSLCSHW
jgi:hypothetical protein